MAIYSVTKHEFRKLGDTTFAAAGFSERGDLQRLLREQIDAIAPGTLVIAEEFGDWEDSRRRIDLLGVDQDANLVVIELKRTDDGGHMELQAVRYAAMVSTMTFEKAVDALSRVLRDRGVQDDAREMLLEHLGWNEPDEDRFAQDVRIVLAAAGFHPELTTAVLWLNKRGLDIRCVRMKPYLDNERVLIDIQQIIPLREAEEYQVRIREKEREERAARQNRSPFEEDLLQFWPILIEKAQHVSLITSVVPVRACADLVAPISGLPTGTSFHFVVRNKDAQIEFRMTRPRGEAKHMFDFLSESRLNIEAVLGKEPRWERLDDRQFSRIVLPVSTTGLADRSNWHSLADHLVDAMVRFTQALRPYAAEIPS